MPIQQICTVTAMDRLGADTWWMELDVGKLVEEHGLRGGQFVHIKCGDGQFLRRPISVALTRSGVAQDRATLIFEVRGEGTRWLSQRAVGDKLDVLGPLGNGFDLTKPGRYLLVGGGIGVPPLLGCAHTLGRRAVMVMGFRSKERALPRILGCVERAGCATSYLCTDDGSLGRHCYVDVLVRELLEREHGFAAVLACGPKPMLRSVARAAAECGVPCQVSLEERMACGVGACLGCAVQLRDGTMKHVCKDGPVFDAGEVDWDA